ncbi:MAG: hypothetical protein WA621_00490 [Candidatus Acidiferrum sp.]
MRRCSPLAGLAASLVVPDLGALRAEWCVMPGAKIWRERED